MTDKPKAVVISDQGVLDIAQAMHALGEVTRTVAGCTPYGVIMCDEEQHMTIMIQSRIEHDPRLLKDFLERLRETCDLYERIFIKNKLH